MELSDFNGDFAKLKPSNRVAQLLFSRTYVYLEKNDTFHLRFMNRTESEGLSSSDEPVESSTDYETHLDTDSEGSNLKSVQNLGHFILSFNQGRLPELPHLGWRVGRGSSKLPSTRGVDLLLARPGDIQSKSLANTHIMFRFNRNSGFLMLRGASPKASVKYNKSGVWETLEYLDEQLMYQVSTMIRAGVCEYELEYTIEEQHREAYFRERNTFLEAKGESKFPEPTFWRLPGDDCVSRGRYLEFQTKGSGAFGWITQGIDTKTGDPIAIKEVRVKSKRDRVDVMNEVKMGNRFQVRRVRVSFNNR